MTTQNRQKSNAKNVYNKYYGNNKINTTVCLKYISDAPKQNSDATSLSITCEFLFCFVIN